MQQTFKFSINELQTLHAEDASEEIKSTFIDETIDGFCEAILEEGMAPVGKAIYLIENNMIIVLEYVKLTEEQKKEIAKHRAAASGITIPELVLK